MNELTNRTSNWSPETIRTVQTKLIEAGYLEGEPGPADAQDFRAALEQWRRLGALIIASSDG
jgi:hypothetical protein